ncbi:right-handed parallel beta-helix repeat-containing protein [Kitasatospora mediocidica]|uniref:right-handed parallel beta-helix repeat-containing protein n=1 Tax=Kitasatospora mediocidica TaxID=58352 RepID=UPI000567FC9A|nr:right-handed parallel beta-helix repeat-containing protein [Kitasatospora mediocidica]
MPTPRALHLASTAAATVLALGTSLGVAPSAQASGRHVVMRAVLPGESIQQALDAADPGDIVQLGPGTYHESVQLTRPGVTLRGVGRQSVLTPGAQPSANACGAAGHGICVTGTEGHRVADVRIESLTVQGFPKNGVSGSETDRMTVRGLLVQDNGEEGIAQEKSTRGVLVDNTARRNGQAGVFLANIAYGEGGAIDTQGAVIGDNDLSANRIGVVVRRARNLAVERNTISGNCSGVFVVGDENRPRAGALTVRDNQVTANNAYCPPNDRLPYLQGIGIVLTGVEDTLVTRNQVRDNVGASPMSGGVVLFRSFNGGASTGVTVRDNAVRDNGPSDLADRDTGLGDAFAARTNGCLVSEPAGHC